ncbi:hypothetical protein OG453_13630 [Streptomyces sp. NBC_01381]|uniref:hypothetical protein n=1 Tax=Streptomyces sp. NBC_01381 TaxID=2903845 RepID=UPI00225739F3|nr:hypothetical protein [Streptomyces sp. NBC_01381]MCX4667694.1 hypothetical protein [Streptomyces sp. NBC_01381]
MSGCGQRAAGSGQRAAGSGNEYLRAAAVLGDASLGGLAEVVPQVPSVGDLDCLGCADGGTLGKKGARSRQIT